MSLFPSRFFLDVQFHCVTERRTSHSGGLRRPGIEEGSEKRYPQSSPVVNALP